MADKRKLTGEFAITVAVVVLILYLPSFGPACWVSSRLNVGSRAIGKIYWPVLAASWTYDSSWKSIVWYATLNAAPEWKLQHRNDSDEFQWGPPDVVFTSGPTKVAPVAFFTARK